MKTKKLAKRNKFSIFAPPKMNIIPNIYMDLQKLILDKAKLEFSKYGIRSVSMDKIAEDLGISKRTLYESFSSKEDLILAFILESYSTLLNSLEIELKKMKKVDNNDIAQLCFIAAAVAKHKRSINHIFFEDLRKYYPNLNILKLTPLRQRSNKMFKQIYISAQNNGFFRNEIDISIVFDFLTDIMDDKLNYISKGRCSTDDLFTNIVHPMIKGISTIKGRKAFASFLRETKDPFFKSILNNLCL